MVHLRNIQNLSQRGDRSLGSVYERRMSFGFYKERSVKFVRFRFTDIFGFLKGFAITDRQRKRALEEGMG
jgi:hypothetical protein